MRSQTTDIEDVAIARANTKSASHAGRFRVWYSYDSHPRTEFAYRNARHEGAAWLEMDVDAGSDQLIGHCYSSPWTTGDMWFTRVSESG